MNELNNTVTALGNYKDIPTTLTFNTFVVNMIDGLKLTKSVDKKNWASGNLTYTIELENQTEDSYTNVIITDILNTSLINFIKGSVKINNIEATSEESSYDDKTHTLPINLNEVAAFSRNTVSFLDAKKT